jgi:serine/threonine-protein kinase
LIESEQQQKASEELEEEIPEVSGTTGQLIADKYRLERVIGRGAMGTVWQAVHLGLEENVAVKLVALSYSQSREARQRFRVEATAAARLRSRFAVQVYDTGETEDGIPYMAMERLEGETLEKRLLRDGALPLVDAVRITSQVARGLSRAHALGIVHRDLKPANIFLARSEDDESGQIAKVLDFGIAKMIDANESTSTTRTGTVLGTPQFMSPEQVRGLKTLDHRADLYSLGAVTFNMLTGHLAFEGEAFGDLLLAICTKPLPRILDLQPGLPAGLDSWFQLACARDPDNRFQTADELAEALAIAAGLAEGSLQQFVAGGRTLAHGTVRDSMAPLPPGDEDEMPTLKRGAEEPIGTVGTSGVLTLGTTGRERRPLWPVAIGSGAVLVLGVLVFLLAFSGRHPTEDIDQDTAAAPAASATLAASAPSANAAPAVSVAPAASAEPNDAGAEEEAGSQDETGEDTSSGKAVSSGKKKHKARRSHRLHVVDLPSTPAKPKKPDLGF